VSCVYSQSADPDDKDKNVCVATDPTVSNTEVNLKFYTCLHAEYTVADDVTNGSVNIQLNGSFSELATLFYGTGEQAVYHLYSKNTHQQFGYVSLATMLVIHFLMACWAAGTYMSCGIVVPMLLIGQYKKITVR
jgi:hypothetical protein